MSNEEIVIHIQAGVDSDGSLLAELWKRNQGFIYEIALRYSGLAETDDLTQEGFIGLSNAVNHWDRDAGTKFLTYAEFWIRESMIKFVDCNSTLSISMNQKVQKFRRTISRYKQEFGTEPSENEICSLMDISRRELASILQASYKADCISLDSPAGEDSESTFGEMLPGGSDLEESVLNEVEREQLSRVLWKLVDDLPGKMPEVLHERYQDEKTLEQIGMETGQSQSAVAWIEKKGIKELRKSHRRKQLEPFADEMIRSKALQGNGIGCFNRTWTSSTERIALEREDE